MRVVLIVVLVVLFVLAGIVFGALNAGMVPYDFGFTQAAVPKGAAVLAALVVGWLLGGLVAWLGMTARYRRRRHGGATRTDRTAPANDS